MGMSLAVWLTFVVAVTGDLALLAHLGLGVLLVLGVAFFLGVLVLGVAFLLWMLVAGADVLRGGTAPLMRLIRRGLDPLLGDSQHLTSRVCLIEASENCEVLTADL